MPRLLSSLTRVLLLGILPVAVVLASPWMEFALCRAAREAAIAQAGTPHDLRDLTLEVFVIDGSQRCQAAVAYVEDFAKRRQGIRVAVRNVTTDRKSLTRLHALYRTHDHDKTGAPTFFACNQLLVGFRDAQTTGPQIENLLTIQAFVRAGCSRCQQGVKFLNELRRRYPALELLKHDVASDSRARTRMDQLARKHNLRPFVPAILVGDRLFVGFSGDARTGRQIEALLQPPADLESSAPPPRPQLSNPLSQASGSSRPHLRFVSFTDEAQLSTETSPQDEEEVDKMSDVGDVESLPEELTPPGAEFPTLDNDQHTATSPDSIELPFWGVLRVSDIGLFMFTFAVGLVDGFNPCAMWVLLFLLSVLVNVKDRKKMVVIAGTFVVVSGLAYFCFMAAWLNLFLLVGLARPVQVALGMLACLIGSINVKDFFALKKGISLSIPESQKPKIYARVRDIVAANYLTAALSGAVVLAVFVNLIELLCTAGLPALFTEVLSLQQLTPWQNYAYLGLYIVAYMFDDTVMLTIAIATLSHRKLQEREGRWLKLISGVVILALGVVMIAVPDWLRLSS